MASTRHPKQEVEEAIRHAEASGWRAQVGGSHARGKMDCPYNDAECRRGEFCITSIWSTPKNPGNHARQRKRVVDNCTAQKRAADAKPDSE